VRDSQPVRQLVSGSVGCLTIERHHRRWHARNATQLRAPARPDGRDIDLVRTSANGFFEAVNNHVFSLSERGVRAGLILLTCARGSSEGDREGAVHRPQRPDLRRIRCGKKFSSAGSPQVLHRSSTGFPQCLQ